MKNKIFSEKIKYEQGLFKKGYIPEDRNYKKLFQILCYPSWEPKENWEFFKNVDEEAEDIYFVVKTMCIDEFKEMDIETYCEQMKSGEVQYRDGFMNPIIILQRFNIDEEYIISIINNLKAIKISPIPEHVSFGCDGTGYELIVQKGRIKSH